MAKKIKVNIFGDMREALRDAAAYERGEAVNLRVARIPARPKQISPKEVREIRQALHASQSLFAAFLNVSPNAVRSWEQGTRRPRQAALKLLVIAKKKRSRNGSIQIKRRIPKFFGRGPNWRAALLKETIERILRVG